MVIDNPYNPNVQDIAPETQPIDQVLKQAIDAALLNTHTWLPARVTKVLGNQKVNLQPLLQKKYITKATAQNLPELQDVMVVMPMGADYSIKLPIAVGDTGVALFCERSLDKWSVSGGIVDPADTRHHHLADPVFVPGLYPFNAQTQDKTTDLVIANGRGKFHVQKAGKFKATNGTNELMDLLVKVAEQLSILSNTLSTDTTNTMFGPQQLNHFTVYADVKTAVDELKAKLNTLKGA